MPTRRVIHRPDRLVTDDRQLIVRFGRDVYPRREPLYDEQLPPAERRRIRESLLEVFAAALRIFDPRSPQTGREVE